MAADAVGVDELGDGLLLLFGVEPLRLGCAGGQIEERPCESALGSLASQREGCSVAMAVPVRRTRRGNQGARLHDGRRRQARQPREVLLPLGVDGRGVLPPPFILVFYEHLIDAEIPIEIHRSLPQPRTVARRKTPRNLRGKRKNNGSARPRPVPPAAFGRAVDGARVRNGGGGGTRGRTRTGTSFRSGRFKRSASTDSATRAFLRRRSFLPLCAGFKLGARHTMQREHEGTSIAEPTMLSRDRCRSPGYRR